MFKFIVWLVGQASVIQNKSYILMSTNFFFCQMIMVLCVICDLLSSNLVFLWSTTDTHTVITSGISLHKRQPHVKANSLQSKTHIMNITMLQKIFTIWKEKKILNKQKNLSPLSCHFVPMRYWHPHLWPQGILRFFHGVFFHATGCI